MTKRNTILGAALLALGIVVLLGVGGGLFASDEIDTGVTIEPHPNNGQYVVSAGPDEVAIDVTAGNQNFSAAVNDDALTRSDDVVLLTNGKSSSVSVWTEDDGDDVTFYRSTAGRPSIEGSDNAVTLAAGETLAVGFELDTRNGDDVESLQDVTFHVSDDTSTPTPTPTPTESGPSVDPIDESPYVVVNEADGATMNASVRNIEDRERFRIDGANTGYDPLVGSGPVGLDAVPFQSARDGEVTFDLAADAGLPDGFDQSASDFERETGAEPLGTVTVTQRLPDGGADWVESELTVDSDEGGPDDVRIYRVENGDVSPADATYDGQSGGDLRFTVRSDGTARYLVAVDRPSIYVSQAELNRTTVPVGGAVNVSATVVNDGSEDGTTVADLLVDGRLVDSRPLAIPADEARAVAFLRRFDVEGSYEIRVESARAGILTVANGSDGGPSNGPGNGSGQPTATPVPPTGPPETPTETPTEPPTESEDDDAVLDLSDVDGPAALALSGMIVFVVLGLLYYVRRRLRDEDDDTDDDPDDGATDPEDPAISDGGRSRSDGDGDA